MKRARPLEEVIAERDAVKKRKGELDVELARHPDTLSRTLTPYLANLLAGNGTLTAYEMSITEDTDCKDISEDHYVYENTWNCNFELDGGTSSIHVSSTRWTSSEHWGNKGSPDEIAHFYAEFSAQLRPLKGQLTMKQIWAMALQAASGNTLNALAALAFFALEMTDEDDDDIDSGLFLRVYERFATTVE